MENNYQNRFDSQFDNEKNQSLKAMYVTQRLIIKDFSRAVKRYLCTHALVSKFKSRKIYNHDGKGKIISVEVKYYFMRSY